MWGAGYRRVSHGSAGTYDEVVEHPLAALETMDDVAAYPWPSPDDFDYSTIAEQCDAHEGWCITVGAPGMPDIVNGVGARGRGMEKLLMDIALRDEVGLAFCGLLSTQQTLPHGSVEDCRAEARHSLDVIAPGGGYIFAPAHCIQPDTPIENVLAIYEEALGEKLM